MTEPARDHSEAFEELAVGWALHALEPDDAQRLAPHLDTCARCRRVVDETTEAMAVLAAAAPAADPPEELRRRLADAVARDGRDQPAAAPAAPRIPSDGQVAPRPAVPAPRRRWTTALVAAGVAAVVGLGGWTVVLVGERDDARAVAADRAALVEEVLRPGASMVVPVADDAGRTVATVVARDDEIQLVSQGLAANDRDAETYVLWGLGGGAPEPLGTFDVTDPAVELRTMPVDRAGEFGGYGVSLEPGRRAPDAPTDVVATGEVPG